MLFASMPLAMWIIGFIYGFIILWMYGSVLTQNEGNLWLGILGGALSAVIMWATGFWFVIMSAINLPVAPSTWAISCLMIVIVMVLAVVVMFYNLANAPKGNKRMIL